MEIFVILNSYDNDFVFTETEEIEKEDSSTLNGFFQKLYDDCDDDQKRAILKSLVESHGLFKHGLVRS
ncbi:Protein SGT1 [Trichinella spiralis]|uniref:Protein SGT1 n=1 Tax=Trichinella spiralis TaxID=6334 RepID=A0ABR3K2J9_TRISP